MPVGGALPLGDKAPEKPHSDGSRWISGGEKDSRGDLPSAFGLQSEGHQWAPEPRPEDPPACEARRVRQNTAPPELPAQPRVNHPAPAGIINKTGDVAGQSGPGSASAGPHLLANSFNEHPSGACSAPHRGEEQSRAASSSRISAAVQFSSPAACDAACGLKLVSPHSCMFGGDEVGPRSLTSSSGAAAQLSS